MKKITDFIVDKRNFILILFIILSIICVILSNKVKINDDITKYLPATSETRIGMDIMEEEFSEKDNSSSLNLMFKGLNNDEKQKILEELSSLENISSIDYDETEDYNKDDYTLYVINVEDKKDSEIATKVYNEITNKYKDYDIQTSGDIANYNIPVLPTWIIVVAVLGVLIILFFMCESYIEPILFLTSILIAILLNAGTNIIFGTISNITNSISAILQLALSMDYSIMLINRFRQEKQVEHDKIKSMKKALYDAFKSISSSSATTIVGLICLVFMSFTIGKDLGFVLAKGVLFSLISIFFVLPALILKFDKLIAKTQKRTLIIKLDKLGAFSNKLRIPLTILFIIIFAGSYILKGNLNILYTASENDEVSKIFSPNNQIAIIYKNEDEDKIQKYISEFEENDKTKSVLAYSNTINEKLLTEELVEKMKDLGTDVDIEDYLLKIVYYKFYNQNRENLMTFDELVKFVQNEVYNNDKVQKQLSEENKKEIDRLSNFTDKNLVNKRRTSSDIANILGMEKEKVDDILIYYNSKNNDLEISLSDFINFMNNKVLTDNKYSSGIDNKTRESINKLTKFTDSNTINSKYTSGQMANLLGITENSMKDLYTYYISVNEIDTKLTLSEFANFVLTDVLTNDNYAAMFDEEKINNIKMLAIFSNIDTIKKDMETSEISSLLGIDEANVKQILLLKYMNSDNGSKLSVPEFIKEVVWLKNNTNYLDGIDTSKFENLLIFAKNENNINTTKLGKTQLSAIFNNVSNGIVDKTYALANLPEEYLMTPQEFVNLVVNTLSSGNIDISSLGIDENSLNSLKLLKLVIDDSVSNNPSKYTATQMANLLGAKQNQMYNLYALIDYKNGNTNDWKCSPYDFVNLILRNMENTQISSNIDENQLASLDKLSIIMDSAINEKTYSYSELASVIGSDENSTKSIYSLYDSKNTTLKLTPMEFVNFVLSHKDDSTLKGKIDASTTNDLNVLNSIMNGVTNNTKYSSRSMSDLLGMDKSKIDLIYGLYINENINKNPTMSLRTMVDFLVNDVMNNKDYANNFDTNSKLKLENVQSIINAGLNETKYTKDEMIAILSNLSDSLEDNTIELLYLYYGSYAEYDSNWKMTIEEFVNFLNDDILKDSKFDEFIDEKIKNDITDSKEKISQAKDLLIGKEYSRIVINTEFESETEETFQFIQNIKDLLNDDINEFYVIGNSPMAYEMSKTFGDEFNYISILTMIAIFIVVAITFKSVTIPVILVGVIQCAVYLTMGILSLSGGSVYFIALLIVQSILMGSTIDYAILYTSYYLENRASKNRKESIINAYNESIHTILTSSSILIIVTFIVGKFATAITSKICITLSKGTLFSTLLILILLPAIIGTLDKFIVNKKGNS